MLVNILRWLLGIGSAAWGVMSLRTTLSSSASFDGSIAISVGLAVLALTIAAILIAPEFTRLISSPLLNLIEQLYLPGEKADKPPLSFRLGHFYAAAGRLKEAEKDYRRMLRFYPEQPDGWIELMTVYWIWKPKSRKRDAVQTFNRGMNKIELPKHRARLEHAMKELKNGGLPVDFAALAAEDKAAAATSSR